MIDGGGNDSFDTSIVNDFYEDDFINSSGPSQISSSSQGLSLASQDSIRDFADNADEDLILRSPFHPSLASTRHTSLDKDRTPVPELIMPTVEVESPGPSRHSSRTMRYPISDQQILRRRGHNHERDYNLNNSPERRHPEQSDRFSSSLPEFLFKMFAGLFSFFGMVFTYSKPPLAILLSLYLVMGLAHVMFNAVTFSLSNAVSPLCRIPGVSYLGLSFCPGSSQPVEFSKLMEAQGDFELVLEESVKGVSLPMEMKLSELAIKDLRIVVRQSDLRASDELVFEMTGYVDIVHGVSKDLLHFNTHLSSAVDSVIAANRWTSKYLDSVVASREENDNLLSRVSGWMFSPFQPMQFDERRVRDRYIEHTSHVCGKISSLISEAHAILDLLYKAEGHLDIINELAVRSGIDVEKKRDEVFWQIGTFFGVNFNRLNSLKSQLYLLRDVERQRTTAVKQLTGLVFEMEGMQAKLEDLREHVSTPEMSEIAGKNVPLIVHIETINAGLARLQAAKVRIRAEEEVRLNEFEAWRKQEVPQIGGAS